MSRNGIPSSVNPTQEEQDLASALCVTVEDLRAARRLEQELYSTVSSSSAVSASIASAAEPSEGNDELALAIQLSLQEAEREREHEEAAVRDAIARSIPKPIISRPATPGSEDEELARVLVQSALEQEMTEKLRAQEAKVKAESEALHAQQEAKQLAAQQASDKQEVEDLLKAASASIVSVRAESQNSKLFQTLLSYLRFMPNRKKNLDNLKEFDPKNRAPFNYTVNDFGLFEVIFEIAVKGDFDDFRADFRNLFEGMQKKGNYNITTNLTQHTLTFKFLDEKLQTEFFYILTAKLPELVAEQQLVEFKDLIAKTKTAIGAAQSNLAAPNNPDWHTRDTFNIRDLDQAVKNAAEFLTKQKSALKPGKHDELLAQLTQLKAEAMQVFDNIADRQLRIKQNIAASDFGDITMHLANAENHIENDAYFQKVNSSSGSVIFDPDWLKLVYASWSDVAQDVKDVIFPKFDSWADDFLAKRDALKAKLDAFTVARAHDLPYIQKMKELVAKAQAAITLFKQDDSRKDLYVAAVDACNNARAFQGQEAEIQLPEVKKQFIALTSDMSSWGWANYRDVNGYALVIAKLYPEAVQVISVAHTNAMRVLNEASTRITSYARDAQKVVDAYDDALAKLDPKGEYKEIISRLPDIYQSMRDQLTICYQDHQLKISAELQKQQQIEGYMSFISNAHSRINTAIVTLNAAKNNLADDELYKQAGDALNDAKIFANSKSWPNSNFIEIEKALMSKIARIEGAYNAFSNKRVLVLQLQTSFIANVAARANDFHEKITATAAMKPDAVTLFLDDFNPKLQAAKVALAAAQAEPSDDVLFKKLEDAKSAITSDDVKKFVAENADDTRIVSLKAELKGFIKQCKAFDVSRAELQRAAASVVHHDAPGLIALVEDNLGYSASVSKVSQPEGSLFNKVEARAAGLFSSKPSTQAKSAEPKPVVQAPVASSSDASSSSAVAGGLFKGSAKWWTAEKYKDGKVTKGKLMEPVNIEADETDLVDHVKKI